MYLCVKHSEFVETELKKYTNEVSPAPFQNGILQDCCGVKSQNTLRGKVVS